MIKLTDKALLKVKELLNRKGPSNIWGIKVGVRARGCSGRGYFLEYAVGGEVGDCDELEVQGVKLFLDRKSLLFLPGTEIDYAEKLSESGMVISSGFVFSNPKDNDICKCADSNRDCNSSHSSH
jgi:iron-sulfur cluster assembly protein